MQLVKYLSTKQSYISVDMYVHKCREMIWKDTYTFRLLRMVTLKEKTAVTSVIRGDQLFLYLDFDENIYIRYIILIF